MNNFEKIKDMNVEEMEEFLGQNGFCGYLQRIKHCFGRKTCDNCIKEWLLQEVSENDL